MKYLKFIVLVFIALFFISCESNDNAVNSVYIPRPVNKKVLVEFFTNAGCNPCIVAHNYLDQIYYNSGVTINDTSVIVISYHTKYPYILDSLYRANIPHNQGRCDYYGVNFTPQARLNGVTMGQFSSSNWTAQINSEFNTVKYLNFSLTNNYDEQSSSGTVTAIISLANPLPASNNVIHFVIIENNVNYVTAPNGITKPNDVMRTLITGVDGEPISIGQSNSVSKNYSINPNWNPDECYIIVFIQNPDSKQVFGVEKIKVLN